MAEYRSNHDKDGENRDNRGGQNNRSDRPQRRSGHGEARGGYRGQGSGERRDDRRGGYGGSRDERSGGYRGQGGRDDRGQGSTDRRGGQSGGYRGRDDRQGGFRGQGSGERRDDRRGGYGGSRDERSGGYRGQGGRDDRGQGSTDRRGGQSGGYRGRDDRQGGFRRQGDGGRSSYGGRPRSDAPRGQMRDKKPQAHQGEFRSEDPNEPIIPAGVAMTDLDKGILRSLSTLSGSNQEIVARHLVVAGQLIDVEPELAYQHAQAAVKRAGRVDVVREAAALTAYASGRYEEGLREVRAVRRMRGDDSLRAIEADCERGLGRPERAIAIIDETDSSQFPLEEQIELVLVAAGARADMGQLEYSLLIVDQALDTLPADVDEHLSRRLLLLKAERLGDLDRPEEAQAILAALPEESEQMEIIDLDALLDGDVDNVRTDLRSSERPLSVAFDGALLDLDGVCFHGAEVYADGPKALEQAEDNKMQLAFVTNNASLTAADVAAKLNGMGYSVEDNQVVTAAMDLMYDLAEKLPQGSTVLTVGSAGLASLVRESGYQVVADATGPVDAVVQGYAPDVNWAILSEAAYAINAGAAYYATNLDATLPTERGFALGNGSLVAAVMRATGVRPVAAGKPRPEIFTRTAEKLHIENPIAVGDRLETDITGAIAARIPSMHVLTGVNSARDVVMAPRGQRPSFVAIDVEGLNQVHPRAYHHRDGTWTCGVSQTVKIGRGGNVEINEIMLHEDGDEVTVGLDTFRALIAASWDFGNERRVARCPQLKVVPNDDEAGIVTESNVKIAEEIEIVEQVEELLDGE